MREMWTVSFQNLIQDSFWGCHASCGEDCKKTRQPRLFGHRGPRALPWAKLERAFGALSGIQKKMKSTRAISPTPFASCQVEPGRAFGAH